MLANATKSQPVSTIIVKITPQQRLFMVQQAHGRMNYLMGQDSNAWVTPEYVMLENLVYNLTQDCAE